jgi:hypothetical protein
MSRHMIPLLVCSWEAADDGGDAIAPHMIGLCISRPNSPAERTYVLRASSVSQ